VPRPSKQPRVQVKKSTPAPSREHVSGPDLANALEENLDEVLSDRVREYLCRFLRGQVKKRPGPQKPPLDKLVHEVAAKAIYRHELVRIRAERKAQGRTRIKPERSPHEEACWIIKHSMEYFRPMSLRRIANIISARKSR
jgi:hypothetical protein